MDNSWLVATDPCNLVHKILHVLGDVWIRLRREGIWGSNQSNYDNTDMSCPSTIAKKNFFYFFYLIPCYWVLSWGAMRFILTKIFRHSLSWLKNFHEKTKMGKLFHWQSQPKFVVVEILKIWWKYKWIERRKKENAIYWNE